MKFTQLQNMFNFKTDYEILKEGTENINRQLTFAELRGSPKSQDFKHVAHFNDTDIII